MDAMKIIKAIGLLAIGICALSLQACVNAAWTGAQAAYGRHNLQNSFNDQYINLQVDHAIYWYSDKFKNANISVYTFNNIVLLTGQVSSEKLRIELGSIVKNVPGVKDVYNQTTVTSPTSPLMHVNDAWITAKIKTQLIAANEIDPSQIKVITEQGTVYLMGIVLPEQADIATEIAKTTSGVEKVVKVFSYIHISKMQLKS
jgi:osmotically-inducible protein OsmY